MLKLIYIVLFSFLLLFGCASLTKKESLYDSYTVYSAKLNAENSYLTSELESWFDLFSPRYQAELLNGRKKTLELLKQMIASNLNVRLDLEKIVSHYETINPEYSCLLLNTVSKKNERIALYFRFTNDSDRLIDNIAIEYLSDFEKYLSQPICDSELLMKKRMEAWN